MAIPVTSFQILTPEQADPIGTGMLRGERIRKGLIQNRYLGPTLAEQLKQLQLKTPILQAQSQYEPQMEAQRAQYYGPELAEQLKQLQLKTPIMEAQARYTPQILASQAAIAPEMDKAKLAQIQQQTKVLPYTAMGSYYSGLGKAQMGQYYNKPAYVVSRMMNNPAFLSLASTNPKLANQFAKVVSRSVMRAAQGYQQNLAPDEIGLHMHGSDVPSGLQQAPQHAQQESELTPTDISMMQQSIRDSLEKKTTTANIMNQRQYAAILDGLFSQGDPLIGDVSKYAGGEGKAQLVQDRINAARGVPISGQYSNYLLFSRTLAPLLSNEMRRTLGGQATDEERKVMDNLANPSWIDSNPQQALRQWDFMKKIYRSSIGRTLARTPSQATQMLQNTGASMQTKPTYTQADLENTARKYNITVAEVKARLSQAGGR